MPNLFPVGYENELSTAADLLMPQPIGYKPSADFDFEQGDFIRNGAQQIESNSGIDAWEAWCKTCLLTDRYNHTAYTTDFGIEFDAVFKCSTREEAESMLTRQITEALTADPYGRTSYVQDISYEWIAPDAVLADVTIVGIDDVTINICVPLPGGDY